jgi:hypothetical protein
MATITNAVEPADGGARVTAETDLHITGPQARFGRGVMEDVAGRVLEEFSSRLERQLAGDEERPAEPARAEALDMGAVMSESAGRYVRMAAPLALGLLLLLALRRRRR